MQLFDKENEEELWAIWLHKEHGISFDDFKKKHLKKTHKPQTKALTKDEEAAIIKSAAQFIKPTNVRGEEN